MNNMKEKIQGFKTEFSKVTRARHPFEIRQFVVGHHSNRWRQWYQLCIETDSKWMAIQEAEAKQRLAALEIEELELKLKEHEEEAKKWKNFPNKARYFEIQKTKCDIEIQQKKNQLARADSYMIGAVKEIQDFLHIAETEFKDFWGKTEEELIKEHEEDYYIERMSDQIAVDLLTFGRPQAGNLSALLQMPDDHQKEALFRALAIQKKYGEIANISEEYFKRVSSCEPFKRIEGGKE